MKIFRILIPIFLITCFLTSCSMEKRVYRRGYHVDWNKKGNEIAAQNEIIPQPETKNGIRKNQGSIIPLNSIKENKTISTATLSDTKTFIQKPEKKDTTRYSVKKKQGKSFDKTAPDQESGDGNNVDPIAVESFAFALLALVGLLMALAFEPVSMLILLLLLSIPAIICGAIALGKIKQKPGTSNKVFTWIGLSLGILEFVVLLFSLLVGIFMNFITH